MNSCQPTPARVAIALTVALLTDLVQLPINLMFFTGFLAVPSEMLDMVLDAVAFIVTTSLLGFHVALLPTAFIEALPVFDGLPCWTACVGLVVAQRKREAAAASQRGVDEPHLPAPQATQNTQA